MKELAKMLIDAHLSISSVESFTVGHFASRIGMNPGISKVYRGSIVSYQTMIKHKVVGIDQDLIDKYGVVSSQIAREMCLHGQKIFDSDICISFTGNAGPDAMEGKPVGLIYIGIAYLDHVSVFEYRLSGKREDIVEKALQLGIDNLKNEIEKNTSSACIE